MRSVKQTDILTGSIPKQLLLFFLPIWFGTLFQQLYNTADTLIVGNFVGTNALAAVGATAHLSTCWWACLWACAAARGL